MVHVQEEELQHEVIQLLQDTMTKRDYHEVISIIDETNSRCGISGREAVRRLRHDAIIFTIDEEGSQMR